MDSPLFNEFFESGMEESISPFLTPQSRKWGRNLSLKTSLLAALFLLLSYLSPLFPGPLSNASPLFLLLTFFLAGIPALILAVQDLVDLEINIDVLMTLAAFLSLLIGSGKEGGLLLVLFAFSAALEDAVRSKAKGTLSSLKQLAPEKALFVTDEGEFVERSVRDIPVSAKIHIRAGDVVPLDGDVVEGASSVNLVHLTGENLPVPMKAGDHLPAGGINQDGSLLMQVTHRASDSTIERLIHLVTQAQESKPKLQRWIDRFSNLYASSIIALSFLFASLLPLITKIPYLGVEGSIYRALAFLIAASPCALVIAIPIAYLSALSRCARQGILLKGGVILDALAKCDTFALDKTGTLTTGELRFLDMHPHSTTSLEIAYSLEQHAHHPIALSLVALGKERGLPSHKVTKFHSHPGQGIEGTVLGKHCFLGHPDFILPRVKEPKKVESHLEELRQAGKLIALLLVEERLYFLSFQDTLRQNVFETIDWLKQNAKDVVMLTGDHKPSALRIASEAGIQNVLADLRPEEKLREITNRAANGDLAMVGDGINDAPSLARANVGISMGKMGSRVAIDASDIVLLQDRFDSLRWLIQRADKTQMIVKQNVLLAMGVIVLATLPALLGWIPLWLAVVLHEGGTVIVGLNSLRLLR